MFSIQQPAATQDITAQFLRAAAMQARTSHDKAVRPSVRHTRVL